ncbi:MAG: ABC transporter permease [Alphaproteobacteria bacterium]|nr:ABC transporter permease [Alphaproteobacteria bacterium]
MATVSANFRAADARRPLIGKRSLADWLLGAVAGIVFLALYAPIFLVFALSFFRTRRGEVQWDSFSLDWYGALFSNAEIAQALVFSLIVGFSATLAAIVLATGIALYASVPQRSERTRAVLEFLVFLPFLLPPIITGLSLLILSREIGLPRGFITISIGHTVFVLAIVYRILLTRIQAVSRNVLEASRDLGASRWQTFRYILLPQLGSAMAAAAMLAFALSFDETMITLFLVGDESTLPLRLYAMMRVGFTPEINALVTLVLIASVLLALIAARFIRGRVGDIEP